MAGPALALLTPRHVMLETTGEPSCSSFIHIYTLCCAPRGVLRVPSYYAGLKLLVESQVSANAEAQAEVPSAALTVVPSAALTKVPSAALTVVVPSLTLPTLPAP